MPLPATARDTTTTRSAAYEALVGSYHVARPLIYVHADAEDPTQLLRLSIPAGVHPVHAVVSDGGALAGFAAYFHGPTFVDDMARAAPAVLRNYMSSFLAADAVRLQQGTPADTPPWHLAFDPALVTLAPPLKPGGAPTLELTAAARASLPAPGAPATPPWAVTAETAATTDSPRSHGASPAPQTRRAR